MTHRRDFAETVQRAVGEGYRLESDPRGLSEPRPPWHLFQAIERPSGRRVAIKALSTEGLHEMEAVRFDREVGSLDRPPGWLGFPSLDHPRLLAILSRGCREGVLYYIAPWLPEGSLRSRLMREGRLAVADAVRILDDAAEALEVLHARGCPHQSVKPENLLFDQGRVVLADGFSRLAGSSRDDRSLLDYAAPEVIRGNRPDRRSDIHALATVGYEMLAGRRPFTGTAMEVVFALTRETPPPLTRFRPEAPAGLVGLLERALAIAPEDRPDAARFRSLLDTAAHP